MPARHRRIAQHHRAGRVAPDRHLPHQRHPRALREHQLERARSPAMVTPAGRSPSAGSRRSRLRATRGGDHAAASGHEHQRTGRKPEQRGVGALLGHAAGAGGNAALRHAARNARARARAAGLSRSDLRDSSSSSPSSSSPASAGAAPTASAAAVAARTDMVRFCLRII